MGDSVAGRVAGATALVTGAASGIGRAAALLLAREGAQVAVADVDEAGAEAVAGEIAGAGGAAFARRLDVTSEDDWAQVIERVESELGPLTIRVNSAGISFAKPLTDTALSDWRRVLAVNLDGTFLALRACVAAMRRAGRGSIVNVSSASGVKASPGAAAYCASKAGVIHLTRTVALECTQNDDRIRVNCITPGGVKTPMWQTMDNWSEMEKSEMWNMPADAVPGKRFAESGEVADAILFLASDDSSYITGATLAVDAGYTA